MFQQSDQVNQETKCPICGGQNFEWGLLAGAYYLPGTSLWSMRGRQAIKVRRCVQCNNVVAFIDPVLMRGQTRLALLIALIAIAISILIAVLSILAAASPR